MFTMTSQTNIVDKQVGARPGGRSDIRPTRKITYTYHKTNYFRWWNVFDDVYRMGCWSFWS